MKCEIHEILMFIPRAGRKSCLFSTDNLFLTSFHTDIENALWYNENMTL